MPRTFDGVDDEIVFIEGGAIDDMAVYTAYSLVRPTADIRSERQILNKMGVGWTGAMFLATWGDGGSNKNQLLSLVTTNANAPIGWSVNDALVVNSWNVALATYAGSLAQPKIYSCVLGNTPVETSYGPNTQAGTGTRNGDTAFALTIGSRETADATYFAGDIGPTALWNRVISADERKALGMGFSPLFFPNGLVFYCPVDGRSSPEANRGLKQYFVDRDGTVNGAVFVQGPVIIAPRWDHVASRSQGNNYVIGASSGAYVLTGTAVGLNKGRLIAALGGTYTLTGTAAGLLMARKLTALGTSYAIIGTAASLLLKRAIAALGGSYTLTGTAASLLFNRLVSAASGAYTLTGQAAGLLHKKVLAAASGAYSLVGALASLIYSGAPPSTDVSDYYTIFKRRRK